MAKRLEVYKCDLCGNIVEGLHEGAGDLVCCGQKMTLMTANSVDAAAEKHVPVLKKTATGFTVTVGSVAHPMEAAHYIEWIEIIAGDTVQRRYLQPGAAPTAEFLSTATTATARAYCNLHGLWKS